MGRAIGAVMAIGACALATAARDPGHKQAASTTATGLGSATSTSLRSASRPAPPRERVVTARELRDYVAGMRGDVVYLDFWATWCAPCVKELPELAALRRAHRGESLRIIAVSFDDPGMKDHVRRTLDRAGWDGASLIVKDRDEQNKVVAWLGDTWRSELPARFLLDRSGRRVAEITEFNRPDQGDAGELIRMALESTASRAADDGR